MKIDTSEIGLMALQLSLNEAREWHMISPAAMAWLTRETESKVRLLAAGEAIVSLTDKGDLLLVTTKDETETDDDNS